MAHDIDSPSDRTAETNGTNEYYGPYRFTTAANGDALIYDDHSETAWLQSSTAVSLDDCR